MTAKSKSPEAAQHKVWKAELKSLDAAQRKITKDFTDARKPLAKAVQTATARLTAFDKRAAQQQPRVLSKIRRRRGILCGKLGLPFIP